MALSHTLTSQSSFTPINNQLKRQFEREECCSRIWKFDPDQFFSSPKHTWFQLEKDWKILQGMRREISVGLQSNMGPLTAVRHTINWLEELQYHSLQLTWYIRTLWVSFRTIFIFIGPRQVLVFPCHSVNAPCQLSSELLHYLHFSTPLATCNNVPDLTGRE